MPLQLQVVAGVLDGKAPPQGLLAALDVVGDSPQRLAAAGEGQQVGVVLAAPGRPGQVFDTSAGRTWSIKARKRPRCAASGSASAASDSATPCSDSGCCSAMRVSQASRGPPTM
jgi:glycerol dehydrogenase-like iron-containing ADH family enzyme